MRLKWYILHFTSYLTIIKILHAISFTRYAHKQITLSLDNFVAPLSWSDKRGYRRWEIVKYILCLFWFFYFADFKQSLSVFPYFKNKNSPDILRRGTWFYIRHMLCWHAIHVILKWHFDGISTRYRQVYEVFIINNIKSPVKFELKRIQK